MNRIWSAVAMVAAPLIVSMPANAEEIFALTARRC